MSQDEAISQFCSVTGADEERARGLLEACAWNLELAINMHVDTDPDGRSNRAAQQEQSSISSSSAQAGFALSNINNGSMGTAAPVFGPSLAGRQQRRAMNSGVAANNHNENDDDDDNNDNLYGNNNSSNTDTRGGRFASRYDYSNNHAIRRFAAGTSSSESSAAAAAAASAADAASAATAAYLAQQPDSDVRPPIAPVRQILNPNPIGYPPPEMPHARRFTATRTGHISDVYDAFRDFQAEAQWQEMLQDGEAASDNPTSRRSLQELFRPPLELMYRGSLSSARECATSQNKWLLVNIQNGREFACQILNRDVWSHQTVRDIIKEYFIFWQVYHDSYEGQRYVQFYHVTKLPHVAIIDPRTGELMKSWPTSIDHTSFCDSVTEFIGEHPSPDGSGDANSMKKLRVKEEDDVDDEDLSEAQVIATKTTLYDQSEEAQLEAAIRASLQETKKVNIDDTIEIDDDTLESVDIQDPQIERDIIEPTEKSTVSGNSSNLKDNNSTTKQQQVSLSASFPDKQHNTSTNHNTTPSSGSTASTTAEALKIFAAERPTKIEGPECRIALRFPDGSSLVQKFAASDMLGNVKKFVQIDGSLNLASDIEFVAPPNRKLDGTMMSQTLESLGLTPASRLEVKCVQD